MVQIQQKASKLIAISVLAPEKQLFCQLRYHKEACYNRISSPSQFKEATELWNDQSQSRKFGLALQTVDRSVDEVYQKYFIKLHYAKRSFSAWRYWVLLVSLSLPRATRGSNECKEIRIWDLAKGILGSSVSWRKAFLDCSLTLSINLW